MAKYKKRADGRYQANVVVGIDEETGQRIYAPTIYAKSIRELEEKKSEIRDQVAKGIYADDKNLTVGEWVKEWFEVEKATCGIRTKEMYELHVYKYIVPELGSIRLRELKKSDIQLMINRHSHHRRTCEQLRMTIRQMVSSAIEEGLLYKNVTTNIKLPPKIKIEKRALLDIEKKAISEAEFTDKQKAFIYILLYSGIRRGEILALSRKDFRNRELKIRNVVTFEKGKPFLKSYPKSDAGIRTIPIPDALWCVLEPYLNQLEGLYLFEMERKEGLMSKSSYDKFWRNIISAINKAGGGTGKIKVINGLTAHVFRHNYATMLYYAGIDIKEAQRLLGHSDIRITLEIYTHLDNSKSSAGEKLSAIEAF